VRTSRLTETAYLTGIETHRIDGVVVRIYSREKTVVDCFRRRHDVGFDVALEALKAYMAQGKVNVKLLMEHAKKLKVARAMRPYVETLL
jgi:predicted transcriptional regulator of viral defense system